MAQHEVAAHRARHADCKPLLINVLHAEAQGRVSRSNRTSGPGPRSTRWDHRHPAQFRVTYVCSVFRGNATKLTAGQGGTTG
jgi:hypothetical protein